MVYTNRRATMNWWDQHTKKLKYFSSAKFMKITINLGKDGRQDLNL